MTGHRYHLIDGLGGQWLCETSDEYPEPSPLCLVQDLLGSTWARGYMTVDPDVDPIEVARLNPFRPHTLPETGIEP